MKYSGNAWKFGNDIDTDQIIPSQYLVKETIKEMSRFAMEPQNPNFANEFQEGDIILGGKNFGCGSSREQAPAVLKELGCRVIIAKSFARIFFRNCINLGLLLIELDTKDFGDGDEIEVDTDKSVVMNKTKHKQYDFVPMSDFLKEIVDKGGLVNYIKGSK